MGVAEQLIQCYGLLWRWDAIHLGRGQGVRGHMWGYRQGRRRSEHVDFRDQRGIYALYANYVLVYAGQTGGQGLLARLKHHRVDHLADRWDRFSWFGTRWVKKNLELSGQRETAHPSIATVLDQLEAILIHAAEPALNRSGGRWR